MEDDDGVTIEDEGTDERIASGDDERKESSIHLWISCVLLVIVVVVSLIRLIVKRRTPSLVVVDPQERFEALERVRQRQQQLYQEQTNITEQKRREVRTNKGSNSVYLLLLLSSMIRDSNSSQIFLEHLSVGRITPIPRRVQQDHEEDRHPVDEANFLFVRLSFVSLFSEILEGNIFSVNDFDEWIIKDFFLLLLLLLPGKRMFSLLIQMHRNRSIHPTRSTTFEERHLDKD